MVNGGGGGGFERIPLDPPLQYFRWQLDSIFFNILRYLYVNLQKWFNQFVCYKYIY